MKSKRMNWAGNVSRIGDVGNKCTFLVGKLKEKGSVWRPKCMWVVEIKIALGKYLVKTLAVLI
jgi:hypothetical protein